MSREEARSDGRVAPAGRRAHTFPVFNPIKRTHPDVRHLKLEFAPIATPAKGVLVLFCEEGLKFGSAPRQRARAVG